MISLSSNNLRHRLDSAIRVLCPLIEDHIQVRKPSGWSEYELRKELVGCIMGSQVRHEMAIAATENLELAGMLVEQRWQRINDHNFQSEVMEVLSGRLHNLAHKGSYRFPKTRSAQLAQARNALAKVPLAARLAKHRSPRALRHALVADIPGLGPKQASMFLRNIGNTYELAILDTHVLRYMDIHGHVPMDHARIGTVLGYEKVENIVVNYAETLGYPVGYLDWAIWATMKAARELGL